MKTRIHSLLIVLALLAGVNHVAGQGTVFTYQGRLYDGVAPAAGIYDLRFAIYDANDGGALVAGPLTNSATGVTNGLFAVTLDFGGVFNGSNYWLEIGARTNGGGAFTTLSPRQPIMPTPYAIYSANAGNAATAVSAVTAATASRANSVSATNIVGTVPLAQLSSLTSNQLDAATWQLATNLNGGNAAVATNALSISQNAMPMVTVSAKGIANGMASISNGGAMFGPDTPFTTTSGIQEAINSIMTVQDNLPNSSGGRVNLLPGVFWTTSTIYTPTNMVNFTPKSPQTLVLEGAGEQTSMIIYKGSSPSTVMRIGDGRSGSFNAFNALNFSIRDVGFSSTVNAKTNLLFIDGINGGIFRAHIELCWFENYVVFTNGNYQAANSGLVSDLIPIDVQCNLGADQMTIEDCQFYLVAPLNWATDHGSISRCFFAYSGANTTWPNTSPNYFPAGVSCTEPVGGYVNGNKTWVFSQNYFEGCYGYMDSTVGGDTPISYDDKWESGGNVVSLITYQKSWTFINPWNVSSGSIPTNWLFTISPYVVTSGATNFVHVIDLRNGTFNFPVTATSFTGTHIGNGSGLTGNPTFDLSNSFNLNARNIVGYGGLATNDSSGAIIANYSRVRPSDAVFYDDFSGPNSTYGNEYIPVTKSKSIYTGTNYLWFPHPVETSATWTNSYFVTNGLMDTFDYAAPGPFGNTNAPWASWMTVDLGVKPTHFWGTFIFTDNFGPGSILGVVFVLAPQTNGIDGAYHFGFTCGYETSIGFWDGGLSNIVTTIWPNGINNEVAGIPYTIDVKIAGSTATFDIAGNVFQLTDGRFSAMGGRYMSVEVYDGGANPNPARQHVQILDVGATTDEGTLATNVVTQQTIFSSAENSFTGKHAGNGSGLTGLSANAIVGGLTTNIPIGGHTLYITNGIIMNVQ